MFVVVKNCKRPIIQERVEKNWAEECKKKLKEIRLNTRKVKICYETACPLYNSIIYISSLYISSNFLSLN